jgi:hypothetical protein
VEEIAKQPACRVLWNSKDVTSDISGFNSYISYTDHEEGASDDVELSMDNGEGLWSNAWYPQQGDTLELFMGYTDKMVSAGLFQVDEITLTGAPHRISVKAIASFITKGLRTRNNKAFEAQTLRQIASYFCAKHSLKLIDETQSMLSQIYLDRKTQEDKTDLQFLAELATEYGFIFSVKGENLIFTSYYNLDNAAPIKDISVNQIGNYTLTEKTYDTYAATTIVKRSSRKNKLIKNEQTDILNWADETHVITGHVENEKQAEIKNKSGLWNKNRLKQSGTLNDLPGDPELVAGINFSLTGIGNASGIYHIVKSSHKISGDGAYTTSLEIRKTGTIPAPKRVPAPAKEKTTFDENTSDAEETAFEEGGY